MTAMVKAPDIGVVKSAAKAIRKSLNKTAEIPHSRALDIAANAFGFTSWHACQSHYKRIDEGHLSPKPKVVRSDTRHSFLGDEFAS